MTPLNLGTPMALTDVKARNSKPREKVCKLSDEKSLFLFITPMALGVYPEVSLATAREKRNEA